MPYLPSISLIIGLFVALFGTLIGDDNIFSNSGDSIFQWSSDELDLGRYMIINGKFLISLDILAYLESEGRAHNLNKVEISHILNIVSSLKCQEVVEEEDPNRLLLVFFDHRIKLNFKDTHQLNYISSKILSCLTSNISNVSPFPIDQIPSDILHVIHHTIYYSLGLIIPETKEYHLDYWEAVSRILRYNHTINESDNSFFSRSKIYEISLYSEELSDVESKRLDYLSGYFIRFWFLNEDFIITRLYDRTDTSNIEPISTQIVKYLSTAVNLKCEYYRDMLEVYASICSYIFFLKWLQESLSNEDYYRYRYDNTFKDFYFKSELEKCLTYAGHLPGFNRKFIVYDEFYRIDISIFQDGVGQRYIHGIYNDTVRLLDSFVNRFHIELIHEFMLMYSDIRYWGSYNRGISGELIPLVKKYNFCKINQ